MPGPRHIGWAHRRVIGDIDAAAPYWTYARKLMGFAIEEAARNQLGVYSIRRELPDGAVIIAEKYGEQRRITVIPPQPNLLESRMFKTRAIVACADRLVAVDLEQYQVIDGEIVRIKELNEVVWTALYGEDLIDISAGPDGSYYRPPKRHADDFFVFDFAHNRVGRLDVKEGAVVIERAFPNSGTTNQLVSSEAAPSRSEVYSYSVLGTAINAINADTMEIRAEAFGQYGPNTLRGDEIGITPEGRFIYSHEQPPEGESYVTVIKTADMTAVASINLTAVYGEGVGVRTVVPSPDGAFMYVLGWVAELFSPIPGYTDITSMLLVISTETNTIVADRFYAHRGFYTAMGKVSRDGNRLYVAENLTGGNSGRFFVIDTATLDPIRGTPTDIYRPVHFPLGIGLSSDGKRYYVAGHDSDNVIRTEACIAVCSAKEDVVERLIPLGTSNHVGGMALVTIPMSSE
jgi:DNA-binding beta-propeller fold protein YncE